MSAEQITIGLCVTIFGAVAFVAVQINAAMDYSGDAFDGISLVCVLIFITGLVTLIAGVF